MSPLFSLFLFWRHLSTLCSLQGKKLEFVTHSTFIILLLNDQCLFSCPWLQPQAPSHNLSQTAQRCCWLPHRWLSHRPRKIMFSECTALASAISRTIHGYCPTQVSWQYRKSPGPACAAGCKRSPPATLSSANSGEAEINLLPSPPGLCSAKGARAAVAYLPIWTCLRLLLWGGISVAHCIWVLRGWQVSVWSSTALSALPISSVLFLFKER